MGENSSPHAAAELAMQSSKYVFLEPDRGVLTVPLNTEEAQLLRQTMQRGHAYHDVLDVLLHQVALVCHNNWTSKSVQVSVVKLV